MATRAANRYRFCRRNAVVDHVGASFSGLDVEEILPGPQLIRKYQTPGISLCGSMVNVTKLLDV